jgi:hypothetical protein
MITEVTMYRVVCDKDGCGESAQDDGEYYAFLDAGQAIDEAVSADWYVVTEEDGTQTILCDDHRPKCGCTGCEACKTYPDGNCKVSLVDNEFGKLCEDCWLETPEGKAS